MYEVLIKEYLKRLSLKESPQFFKYEKPNKTQNNYSFEVWM